MSYSKLQTIEENTWLLHSCCCFGSKCPITAACNVIGQNDTFYFKCFSVIPVWSSSTQTSAGWSSSPPQWTAAFGCGTWAPASVCACCRATTAQWPLSASAPMVTPWSGTAHVANQSLSWSSGIYKVCMSYAWTCASFVALAEIRSAQCGTWSNRMPRELYQSMR